MCKEMIFIRINSTDPMESNSLESRVHRRANTFRCTLDLIQKILTFF